MLLKFCFLLEFGGYGVGGGSLKYCPYRCSQLRLYHIVQSSEYFYIGSQFENEVVHLTSGDYNGKWFFISVNILNKVICSVYVTATSKLMLLEYSDFTFSLQSASSETMWSLSTLTAVIWMSVWHRQNQNAESDQSPHWLQLIQQTLDAFTGNNMVLFKFRTSMVRS